MMSKKEIIRELIEHVDFWGLRTTMSDLGITWTHPTLEDYQPEEQTIKLKIAELAEQALTQCQSVEWGCLQIIYSNGDIKFNFVYPFKQ